ncbi:MAG: carboxypeptidase-like regulatory domain-containing protein [Sandaracinaceae bacterium]|nr:carboxypeptidase-like regulatory domain-containing protein [Sandaracinaceae bacterium]
MTRAVSITPLVLLACAALAHAQPPEGHPEVAPPHGQPPPLPEGHPDPQAQPPPGHPTGQPEGLPAGHPDPQAQLPSGHPTVQDPHGAAAGDPHGELSMAMAPPRVAVAEPSDAVPAGAIRVTVLDAEERPVAGADIEIGVLAQGQPAEPLRGRTGADGTSVFAGLSTGTNQAYRVKVPHAGAMYAAMPFQLSSDRGYDVRIRRLPVTRDDRRVLQVAGQTVFEVRDERLHVIHQSELSNFGAETYVLPANGIMIALPEGFTAFQAQQVMTDQRFEEVAGEGVRIRGSIPPGHVSLAWAYDLPIGRGTMEVPVQVPFRTFTYRVISEAPPGLELDVSGMPEPRHFDNEGQPLWVTEVQRSPGDPPFSRFVAELRGIPGPGPGRWIAVALALLMILAGAILAFAGGDPAEAAARARTSRREALLSEARELEEDFAAGDIGPEFRQNRRDAIVRELAALMLEQKMAERRTAAPRPAAARAR